MYQGGPISSDTDEGNTSEEACKKRKGSPSIFQKSTRIKRTPSKKKENKEDMDELKGMMNQLLLEFKDIKKAQCEYSEDIKEIKKDLSFLREERKKDQEEIRALKVENKNLLEKINAVHEDNLEFKRKLEIIDKESRKNNLVMTGLQLETEDKRMMKEAVDRVCKNHLSINPQIKSATKIGKNMIRLEMETFDDKMVVINNKHKLKAVKDMKIFFNNDMTKEERKIHKIIRDRATQERRAGNAVKTGYQKIKINEETWHWSSTQQRLVRKVGNGSDDRNLTKN